MRSDLFKTKPAAFPEPSPFHVAGSREGSKGIIDMCVRVEKTRLQSSPYFQSLPFVFKMDLRSVYKDSFLNTLVSLKWQSTEKSNDKNIYFI